MSTEHSTVHLENIEGLPVLKFAGDIDAAFVREMRPRLEQQLSTSLKPGYILDLSGVHFLDSHGIGFFVSLLKRAHAARGRLGIVGAKDQPLSVLNMVGLNSDLVKYFPTAEAAVKGLSS